MLNPSQHHSQKITVIHKEKIYTCMTEDPPSSLSDFTATCTSIAVAARIVDRITVSDASHSTVIFVGVKRLFGMFKTNDLEAAARVGLHPVILMYCNSSRKLNIEHMLSFDMLYKG
jgi:hypothetical protein